MNAISHLAKCYFLLLEQMANRRQWLLCYDKKHRGAAGSIPPRSVMAIFQHTQFTAALGAVAVPVLGLREVLLNRNPRPGETVISDSVMGL